MCDIWEYLTKVYNPWLVKYSDKFNEGLRDEAYHYRDLLWYGRGRECSELEAMLNEALRGLYKLASTDLERQAIEELYESSRRIFPSLPGLPATIRVVDALSKRPLDGVIVKVDGEVREVDGEVDIERDRWARVERYGYEPFEGAVEGGVVELRPMDAHVEVSVMLVDQLGTLGPAPGAKVSAKPLSYVGEARGGLANAGGIVELKLPFNHVYELVAEHEGAHRGVRFEVDELFKRVHVDVMARQVRRVRVRLSLRARGLYDFMGAQSPPKLYVTVYSARGRLLGRGYVGDVIELERPIELGEPIQVYLYPLDDRGSYLSDWREPVRSFVRSGRVEFKLESQDIKIEMPKPNEEGKGLRLKFEELNAYRNLRGRVERLEFEGKSPKLSEVTFSQYLEWGDEDKVMALFGDHEGRPLRLYEHQLEALRLLDDYTRPRVCVVLAAGMASGKTEVAVLHLLKAFRGLSVEPGGHALVIYPTRELLVDQYARWRAYFKGAYDLGYLPHQVEVVRLYGELAKRHKEVYEREKCKLEEFPCIVLTTASTLVSWANRLEKLNIRPSILVLDEIHFYSSMDLTILVELLRFMVRRYGGLARILMFSATIGGLDEFAKSLKAILGADVVPIKGESTQGPKHMYAIDLSGLDERRQEAHINEILDEYARNGFRDKTMIFAKHRREAEAVYDRLRGRRAPVCLHLGDMGELDRRRAADGFRSGRYRAIVTVKTLEVGIDVGDASRVIHLGLPPSLNEFLQREGRVGRRGQECESIVVLRGPDEVRRFREWVEVVRSGSRGAHG